MILLLNHLHLRDLILRSTYDDFAHLCIYTHTHELFLNIKKGKMYHILMLIMHIYVYIYIAIFNHGTSLIFFFATWGLEPASPVSVNRHAML